MGSNNKTSKTTNDPLASAPILFPWYGAKHVPSVFRNGKQLEWNYREKIGAQYVGAITLELSEQTFGIFRIYNYVFPSNTGRELCVWSRKQPEIKEKNELRIDLYRLDELKEIVDPESKIMAVASDENILYYVGSPAASAVTISLAETDKPFSVVFPKDFQPFDDFFVVLEVEDLYEDPGFYGTALLEMMPNRGLAQIHPQDWFNKDPEVDYGYQWITRAARDMTTGKIVIEGIRIGTFELDESDRKLRKSS